MELVESGALLLVGIAGLWLAASIGISPLVVGPTVVAFGTSARRSSSRLAGA